MVRMMILTGLRDQEAKHYFNNKQKSIDEVFWDDNMKFWCQPSCCFNFIYDLQQEEQSKFQHDTKFSEK